jgi:RNA polymerase sigma-70 factor (ECF subfamily)
MLAICPVNTLRSLAHFQKIAISMDSMSSHQPADAAHLEQIIAATDGDAAARWCAVAACRDYLRLVAHNGHWFRKGSHQAPSDLVQNALVAGWRDFPQFQGRTPGQLRSWLRGILVHAALNAVHAKRAEAHPPEQFDERAGTATSPSAAAQKADSAAALDAALAQLPDHHRAAIQLRVWSRLSFRKVGQRLGISEDAARMLYGRAIVRLRETMSNGHDPA